MAPVRPTEDVVTEGEEVFTNVSQIPKKMRRSKGTPRMDFLFQLVMVAANVSEKMLCVSEKHLRSRADDMLVAGEAVESGQMANPSVIFQTLLASKPQVLNVVLTSRLLMRAGEVEVGR